VTRLALSAAQRRHLVLLLDAPYWHPSTSGEWAVARALERRRLLDFHPGGGGQPYELNARGREVAEAIKAGRR
jgi:hypothetical protein